ncbi:heavy-metal-associated domain-containing protein [Ideonella sp. YS5]|uniref:heavy-metal-associated domain-containing protein n=1 Tax=Ideonella sp. YS5 TaxID=3453714 RepID=UPI003EF06F5F
MQTFRVDDMTCGHCASSITKAVRAVDGGAKVEVDLQRHLVHIEPTQADSQALNDAIAEAGYSPVPVNALATQGTTTKKAGGCCGCCG